MTRTDKVHCMHTHSLVAYVLAIVIISKVVATEDPSRLDQDSETSEHYMPGVPACTHAGQSNIIWN